MDIQPPDMTNPDSLKAFGQAVHTAVEAVTDNFYEEMVTLIPPEEQVEMRQRRADRDAANPSGDVSFYDYYPYLFAQSFPELPPEQMRYLAFASRFCLDFLIAADKLIDGQVKDGWVVDRAYVVLRTGWLQQQAMIQFAALFGDRSPFWQYLNSYYMEYATAVFAEKALFVDQLRPYAWEEMAKISAGKVAMAKSIPTALAILTGQDAQIPAWERSLDLVAVAYQLLDDLRDWKEDYGSQTYSYLLAQAIENGGLTTQVESGQMPPEKTVGQYIYFTGLAESLLHHAHDLYNQAIEAVDACPNPVWSQHVNFLQRHNWRLRTDLWEIREQTILQQLSQREPTIHLKAPAALDKAINAGLDFLCRCQLPEGHWLDWGLTVGSAREYVTAYIGRALTETTGWDHPLLKEGLPRAQQWLLRQQQQQTGGWGWHQELTADADTTSNSLIFLSRMNGCDTRSLDAARNYLLENQNQQDGGIQTYRAAHIVATLKSGNLWWPQIPIDKYQGWLSSTTSLTALGLQALLYNANLAEEEALQQMLAYLQATQAQDGSWPAYWWRGRNFSTHACVNAMVQLGETECVANAATWFNQQQRADGGWGDESDDVQEASHPLHTALAVDALLLAEDHETAVTQGVSWLLAQQEPEGSWAPSPMLLVPDPDELKPWLPGANCQGRGMDNNKLFTTATVLEALFRYHKTI